jgi:hypothetical protein
MFNRRDAMIRLGQLGLGAMTLPGLLETEQAHASPRTAVRGLGGKAKSCIYIFLWGGPPQMDLWDMKPESADGFRSLFKPINTVVPGIDICDQMPLLAKHTDKLAIVRSLTHPSDIHEFSCHHMLTGHKLNSQRGFPRNNRTRADVPFFGSILANFSPPGPMPAAVTIPQPLGHDGVTYAGSHGGFLGPRCDPMEMKGATGYNGDATFRDVKPQPTHPIGLPDDIDLSRLQARRGLLDLMDAQERRLQDAPDTKALGSFYEQAFRMVASAKAKEAFDLEREPETVRERYGRNPYGDSFLLSRRLVEAGVRLVSVIWLHIMADGKLINVWDNHSGYNIYGAKTGYDLLKGPCCVPTLDRAYTALLSDLSDRGLLDETLVVAVGEFGRTPKINSGAGRDHWGNCQSTLLAGGGIRGGQIYGASDKIAAYPRDNPVAPEDLLATIYHAFGLSPDSEILDRENRPHRITDGKPVLSLFS